MGDVGKLVDVDKLLNVKELEEEDPDKLVVDAVDAEDAEDRVESSGHA